MNLKTFLHKSYYKVDKIKDDYYRGYIAGYNFVIYFTLLKNQTSYVLQPIRDIRYADDFNNEDIIENTKTFITSLGFNIDKFVKHNYGDIEFLVTSPKNTNDTIKEAIVKYAKL